VKNKTESTLVFSEMSLLDKAMNLAFFELLGDADLMNQESGRYLQVTAEQIQQQANKLFRKENSTTMVYLAEEPVNEVV
jgi:predicted Zn-dependent peptidase